MWHTQPSLLRTAECLWGPFGTGDYSAARERKLASPVWPDCVADHTYDDLWLIPSWGVATVQKKRTAAATAGGARTPNGNKR